MATELMLDALFSASSPAQLIADINAVGASGAFVYVWRPGGVGNWTPALAGALRSAGKRAVPIIVPPSVGGDIPSKLDAAQAFGFSDGPITLDLEPPNLPPASWEEQFDAAARARGFTDLDYGTDTNLALYQPDDEHWLAHWIESGTLAVIPTLPPGLSAWQFVNDVVINGTSYDVSVVDSAIFGGIPLDQATFNTLMNNWLASQDNMSLADLDALRWRVEALLNNRSAVVGGPTIGEVNQLQAKLATLSTGATDPNAVASAVVALEAKKLGAP